MLLVILFRSFFYDDLFPMKTVSKNEHDAVGHVRTCSKSATCFRRVFTFAWSCLLLGPPLLPRLGRDKLSAASRASSKSSSSCLFFLCKSATSLFKLRRLINRCDAYP